MDEKQMEARLDRMLEVAIGVVMWLAAVLCGAMSVLAIWRQMLLFGALLLVVAGYLAWAGASFLDGEPDRLTP